MQSWTDSVFTTVSCCLCRSVKQEFPHLLKTLWFVVKLRLLFFPKLHFIVRFTKSEGIMSNHNYVLSLSSENYSSPGLRFPAIEDRLSVWTLVAPSFLSDLLTRPLFSSFLFFLLPDARRNRNKVLPFLI